MPSQQRRCESMLFDYGTTYRTDFRDGEISNVIKTYFKPKPVKPRPPVIPLKDIQALFPLRDSNVPFDTYHKHDPIIRSNPWVVQKTFLRPPDMRRLEVQQTRPRVLMTPALPMDDIEEPTRQTLVNFIYKSTVIKAMDEAVSMSVKQQEIKAPLSAHYAPARPIQIEPLRFPYVSPQLRMPSVSWDKRQVRSHTEPTKRFWLAKTPDDLSSTLPMNMNPLRDESMLFNNETTYRTDYRDGEIKNVIRTVYVPKPVRPRPKLEPLKDIQALFPLRDPNVPFNMFHRPLPIIRTSPCVMQEVHLRPVDEIRPHVQRTRPEVIMTPALNLDTVEEPMREKIINHVYKTTQVKAMDDSVALSVKHKDVRAPPLGKYTPAKMITIKPLKPGYVSPEWRMPSASWDNAQLRTYTEPTKRFWLAITPSCVECKRTAERRAAKLQQMKRN